MNWRRSDRYVMLPVAGAGHPRYRSFVPAELNPPSRGNQALSRLWPNAESGGFHAIFQSECGLIRPVTGTARKYLP